MTIYNWLKSKQRYRKVYLFLRGLRHCWQYCIRGFSDRQLWSLDITIAKFILPRLKRFKEINENLPFDYEKNQSFTEAEWLAALDDMIFAMNIVASEEILILSGAEDKAKLERYQKGIHLFSTHFTSLWL